MPRSRPLLVVQVILLCAFVGALAGVSAVASASPSAVRTTGGITFGEPTVSGVQGVGFEQGMRISRDGTFYTSAPGSLSGGTSWIWRSVDGGRTFKWVPSAEHHSGKLTTACVGGGDSELATDSANNLYFNDLTLANFSTSRSGDHGTTMAPSSCTGVTDSPVDRQWYAVDGDPTNGGSIYLAYDWVGSGSPSCESSTANNTLRVARSPAPGLDALAGVEFAPPQSVTQLAVGCEEGIMGNDEVSPRDHKVFVIHDNASFDGILLGVCTPVAFGPPVPGTSDPSGLQCVDKPVTTFPGNVTGGSFPTMTIDRAGNVYAVWEQAPGSQGAITPGSDTVLRFASSNDEGDHWHITTIPTTGLHNNVFAWPAAGDDGKVDVAWYGTSAPNPDPSTNTSGCSGPDGTDGADWSVYFAQTRNATAIAPTFTSPIQASDHFIHRGGIQTVMGGQCGDRTLGDFLNLRLTNDGRGAISYGDSNNQVEFAGPHPMVVIQNGGPGVYGTTTFSGPSQPRNTVNDPAGDATFDAESQSSQGGDNLDILGSSVTQPDASHYRIQMTVKDLTSLSEESSTNPDQTLVWQTQWLVPSTSDPNGGANFMVYMESQGGGAPTFWVGQNSEQTCCNTPEGGGGGVTLTYPGTTQLTSGVSYTATAPGTITIDVPISDVSEPNPIDNHLHQVIASTMTYTESAEDPTCAVVSTICGHLFALIDVSRTYDYAPPAIRVQGHAHTDYNNDGVAGVGDVHLKIGVSGGRTPPAGGFEYRDLRDDPPGPPTTAFDCFAGTPSFVGLAASNTAVINGTMTCDGGLSDTAPYTYTLSVTDNGPNPPNSDAYHITISDGRGNVVYDWGDQTTVGLGELAVSIQNR